MSNELIDFAASFFAPDPDLSVKQWAEKYLLLMRGTETPGPYSTLLYPYVAEVLECFRDRTVSDVVLCWGSQTTKTTTLLCGLAWTVRERAVDALWAMDSADSARSVSKHRWRPMVEDSPRLAEIMPSNPDLFTNLEQQFGNCVVKWIGSNSPGRAASTPVGLVIQDEVDKYREGTAREASSARLIDERTKGFAGGKRFKSSTPTTEHGTIWREWMESDQRRWFVPCPHCGEWDYLRWENIRWPGDACDESGRWDYRRVKRETRYICPHCGKGVDESVKSKMIRQGEWRPTNTHAAPGFRGYHISTLYSPQKTWGECAVKFLREKDDPDGLRNFVNSWLAEPWTERATSAEPSELQRAKGDYARGAPLGSLRVMTVDVQRTDFRYLIRGYDGTLSRLLDYGQCASWSDLDELQEKFAVDHVGVDTGFGERTQECYEHIHERAGKGWFGIKGQERLSVPFAVRWIAPFTGKKGLSLQRIRLMHINQELWKGEMAKRRIGQVDTWQVPQDLPPSYARELFCEYQTEKTVNGRRKVIWKAKHKENHAWDCECYQLAVAQWLGLGRVVSRRPVIRAADPAPAPQEQPAQEAEAKPRNRYIPLSRRRPVTGEAI